MQNGSAAASSPDLPPELAPDFTRLESALETARERGALSLSSVAVDQLRSYGVILHRKSSALSLIAKGDRAHLFTRHVLDSLNPTSVLTPSPESALDVGSGAGLPGIPLAIAWPETRVVLLESRERKAAFIESAVRELRLRNVEVVCGRLEDFGRTWRKEPVACVLVRALGGLPEILSRAKSAARTGSLWVYFLGDQSPSDVLGTKAAPELQSARIAAGAFAGRLLVGSFTGS